MNVLNNDGNSMFYTLFEMNKIFAQKINLFFKRFDQSLVKTLPGD